jgi:hypothetical protein
MRAAACRQGRRRLFLWSPTIPLPSRVSGTLSLLRKPQSRPIHAAPGRLAGTRCREPMLIVAWKPGLRRIAHQPVGNQSVRDGENAKFLFSVIRIPPGPERSCGMEEFPLFPLSFRALGEPWGGSSGPPFGPASAACDRRMRIAGIRASMPQPREGCRDSGCR